MLHYNERYTQSLQQHIKVQGCLRNTTPAVFELHPDLAALFVKYAFTWKNDWQMTLKPGHFLKKVKWACHKLRV